MGNISGKQERDHTAYALVKESIMRGHYLPGHKLVERDVAEQLGVSRSPVRWALHRLEGEDFLERTDRRVLSVKRLSIKEALELLDVRERLEGLAAKLAAERRTGEDIDRLVGILQNMAISKSAHSPAYPTLARDLHLAVFQAADNGILHDMIARMFSQTTLMSHTLGLENYKSRDTMREHEIIVANIIEGNATQAERSARLHIRKAKRHLQHCCHASLKR